MKNLFKMKELLIDELGNNLLICNLREYNSGYISDAIVEIAKDRNFYENIQAAQFYVNEQEMYNNLETGIQLYIVDKLINMDIKEIPDELESDIYMLNSSDYDYNDRIEDLNELIETYIDDCKLDCTLENVKKLSDKLGYKEFRNCLDNDDIYRTIDQLNISRETHYDENDVIGGYEYITVYGYTTIELRRGLNYVTPVDVVERITFEEWNNEEKQYMSCSNEYIGISKHDYPVINESEEQ